MRLGSVLFPIIAVVVLVSFCCCCWWCPKKSACKTDRQIDRQTDRQSRAYFVLACHFFFVCRVAVSTYPCSYTATAGRDIISYYSSIFSLSCSSCRNPQQKKKKRKEGKGLEDLSLSSCCPVLLEQLMNLFSFNSCYSRHAAAIHLYLPYPSMA